ncbi:hypothetical protein [Clostridium beijerinckii]|uniref:hypothetical protein n=1 Tax=Clostridium beijerinckii TaxID=1520 RepID=UPI00156E1320|nr:hypothetical protein [Clostridium beijerinckii]NRU52557.1 hypothetical protein [Clostridium beijerinckii]NYC69266.1 hypothetical protein [Clostridium beijerinckii]NYC91758.1 hypothetical protein [Clostridium beijerinckii]
MATVLRDALYLPGTHNISEINTIWAKPVANGAILSGSNMDNGGLVEFAGRDANGNRLCKPYDGTGEFFILQTHVEDQLLIDMGETDYKNFYNKVGEPVRLIRVETGLAQELSGFTVDTGVTLAQDLPVIWDATNKVHKVVASIGAGQTQIATVVDLDTDFGYNAGVTTIRIEYK